MAALMYTCKTAALEIFFKAPGPTSAGRLRPAEFETPTLEIEFA